MGVGKTSIGKRLARCSQRVFHDSDHEVERRTGVSIDHVFDIEGEAGFREREARAIDDLTALDSIVLATGGGSVLREDNRSYLTSRGFVVYLRAGIEQLLLRTSKRHTRPLLQNDDPEAVLKRILKERDPLYRQVADEVVATDGLSVQEIVVRIMGTEGKKR